MLTKSLKKYNLFEQRLLWHIFPKKACNIKIKKGQLQQIFPWDNILIESSSIFNNYHHFLSMFEILTTHMYKNLNIYPIDKIILIIINKKDIYTIKNTKIWIQIYVINPIKKLLILIIIIKENIILGQHLNCTTTIEV